MSGVVFEVKPESPHHEIDGKRLYFCCQGCANYFAGNRDDVIAKRGYGRAERASAGR